MHIRRSKSRDRTAVLKLARRFSQDIGLHNLPLLADHIGTDRVVVACQDNDRPMAFVYAYLKGKGSSPYSPGRDHLYVAAICVDSDNRKKGIASALMKELVKSNSHRKICGQVFCSNAAAKKLYTKNGFNELCVVFSKEAFKEADKSTKTASIKPFEITSMAGGIKCPYCGSEGFDTKEFDEHLKYCQEYLKIKDTPLTRPLMKGSGIETFYVVEKPSKGATLKGILFEVGASGLQTYLEGFTSGEIEGIFTDKFVAETVAKSLLEAMGLMDKEGSAYRDSNDNILVKEGDFIEWGTLDGTQHKGKINEMDANMAVVDCETCGKECFVEL